MTPDHILGFICGLIVALMIWVGCYFHNNIEPWDWT